jgi:hypothetical protein
MRTMVPHRPGPRLPSQHSNRPGLADSLPGQPHHQRTQLFACHVHAGFRSRARPYAAALMQPAGAAYTYTAILPDAPPAARRAVGRGGLLATSSCRFVVVSANRRFLAALDGSRRGSKSTITSSLGLLSAAKKLRQQQDNHHGSDSKRRTGSAIPGACRGNVDALQQRQAEHPEQEGPHQDDFGVSKRKVMRNHIDS